MNEDIKKANVLDIVPDKKEDGYSVVGISGNVQDLQIVVDYHLAGKLALDFDNGNRAMVKKEVQVNDLVYPVVVEDDLNSLLLQKEKKMVQGRTVNKVISFLIRVLAIT